MTSSVAINFALTIGSRSGSRQIPVPSLTRVVTDQRIHPAPIMLGQFAAAIGRHSFEIDRDDRMFGNEKRFKAEVLDLAGDLRDVSGFRGCGDHYPDIHLKPPFVVGRASLPAVAFARAHRRS
jgi:hypothetical protein